MPAAKLYNCSGNGDGRDTKAKVDDAGKGDRRRTGAAGAAGPKPNPSRPGRNPSNLESNITLFTAPSVEGPWTSDGVVLGADCEGGSTYEPCVAPRTTVVPL